MTKCDLLASHYFLHTQSLNALGIYNGLHCQMFMPISNNFAQIDSIWKIKEHSSLLDMISFRQMLHCGYLEADGCPIQYIPRNMHTVFALLCFVVVIHWLVFPYPSGLLHWHCGNLMIAPVPAKQPWWIWINTSCEFIMNDCIDQKKRIVRDYRHKFRKLPLRQYHLVVNTLPEYLYCTPNRTEKFLVCTTAI